MKIKELKDTLEQQHQFFLSGQTRSIDFRIQQLNKLKSLIKIHETDILEALNKDMHKHAMESELSEILMVMDAINHVIKHLKKWMRPLKVKTPFPLLWPGKSTVYVEPYGTVLIISPWNYPFLLLMNPLIGAIAAGNCVLVKPSEIATHTALLITTLINNAFKSEYIYAVNATAEEIGLLLEEKWDYIFFTGSSRVGKIVMQAAAKQLTPVTLELGGKSPCVVDSSADLDFAARRIVMGKMMNAGQTCIAPDYLLVHQDVKESLIHKIKTVLIQFYGNNPQMSDSFGRIINNNHFNRLKKLFLNETILVGGDTDENTLYFSPTLIDVANLDSPIMQEEIFGPILPVVTFDTLDHAVKIIQHYPKPLAFYLFTQNKVTEDTMLTQIQFGGGCINDCLLHVANVNLPFGGVGNSGMGRSNGKYFFESFSNKKSIYKKTMLVDFNFMYPPYSDKKRGWIRRLLF